MRNGSRFSCTILHVSHVSKISGAEVSLLTLMHHLNSSQYEQILACPPQGPLSARAQSLGITVKPLSLGRFYRRPSLCHALRMASQFIAGLLQTISLIRRSQVTVVHANSTTAALVALPAASICRVPALWHIRDGTSLGPLAFWLGRLATTVIVPAQHMLPHLAEQGVPTDKIQIIPNGIEIDPFLEAAATRRTSESTHTVGMVAQVVPWKRHMDFIRAAAIIHQELPHVRFRLIGSDLFVEHAGYQQELIDLIARSGLTSCFSWLGFQDDIASQLADLDVVVLPSCQEPFGRVLLESLLAGAVPVAVDSAGPAEIIQNAQNGILVPCGNYHAIADETILLLRNGKKRAKIVSIGRDYVIQHFGGQVTTRLFEQLLSTWSS